MRFLRFALCGAFLSLWCLRAAEEEEKAAPPEEIPDFGQLDEYTYVPKSTLSLGNRIFRNGPKTTYSGQGTIPSTVSPGDNYLIPNILRTYVDGTVGPDARTVVSTNGVASGGFVSVAPDGKTNSWSFNNATQLQPNGDIDFHAYNGLITDTGSHEISSSPTVGLELVMDRDMGKIGKHMKWSLTAGFSISDIHSSTYANVPTTLTTLTDAYDLFGSLPPTSTLPFTSPNTLTQTITSGSTNAAQTQLIDQTILLGNSPLSRTILDSSVITSNRYFIEGAYYTLRLGPTLIMPISKHFNLSISAGPALIYAGSELNVLQDLTLATGDNFQNLYQKENSRLLPGYYVDVDLQYQLTDTAGFYVGGVYQGAGGFTQSVASGGGQAYASHIDFGNQQGLKSGLTVRF